MNTAFTRSPKKDQIEKLFAKNPKCDKHDVARQVGCSVAYAADLLDTLRIRHGEPKPARKRVVAETKERVAKFFAEHPTAHYEDVAVAVNCSKGYAQRLLHDIRIENGTPPTPLLKAKIIAALKEKPQMIYHARLLAEQVGCSQTYVTVVLAEERRSCIPARREVDIGHHVRWLAKECHTELDTHLQLVAGKTSVTAAHGFAKFFAWSGILDLVQAVDEAEGKELRRKCADLTCACLDYYKMAGTSPETEDQQIPTINRKLDVLFEILHRQNVEENRKPNELLRLAVAG